MGKHAHNTGLLIGAIQNYENGDRTAEETLKTLKQKMKQ